MNWGSLENFLAMGGYATYVWGSYLVTLAVLIAELVLLAQRRRRFLGELRARAGTGRGGA
jgi:heme exporter protein D